MNILVAMPDDKVRSSFIPPETALKLEALGNVTWNTLWDNLTVDELKEKIKGKDICVTGWGCRRIDEDIIDCADQLKLLLHTGGTVAPFVCDKLFDKGIKVISGNELYAESVAEGTLAYILCSLRDIPYYNNEMHQGRWKSADAASEGLLDQTIGIIGYGAITRYLLSMLKPFRGKVKLYSNHLSKEACNEIGVEKNTIEEIFTTCKIISLHNSLTKGTYHMIGRDLLSKVPDGALLINIARGAIIDEKALEAELSKKRFKAVLDVFEEEPLPADSVLRKLDNVILIPHMGGPTTDRRKMITEELIRDAEKFFTTGELKYEITRENSSTMTKNNL